jgi:poly-D-alanine transfer protein DltD
MLPKSYLKAIAAYIVYESKLSKYAKIQMLRFIENEASENQLIVLVTEGEIRKVSEDENISEAVIVVPALLIATALSFGRIAYDKMFSQAAKMCAAKDPNNKKQCIKDFKIKSHYAKITALKREMGKCNQTNNAKKCRDMFIKHIRKIEKQVQKVRAS